VEKIFLTREWQLSVLETELCQDKIAFWRSNINNFRYLMIQPGVPVGIKVRNLNKFKSINLNIKFN